MKYLYFYQMLTGDKELTGDGELIATLYPIPTTLAIVLSNRHPILKSKAALAQIRTNPRSLPHSLDYEIKFPKECFDIISNQSANINQSNLSELEETILDYNTKYTGKDMTRLMSILTMHTSNYSHQLTQVAKILNKVKIEEESPFNTLPITHVLIKRRVQFNLDNREVIRLK